MSELNLLNLAFLENHPRSAAAVLQRVAAEDAAAFLGGVPVRVLVPVLGVMEPWPAAKILSQMTAEQSAGILCQLVYQDAAALLRLQDETARQRILEGLPAGLARDLGNTLSYPANTTGAWMDTTIPYFQGELSVSECLELIRVQQHPTGSLVSVVNADRRLIGVIELDALLINPGNSRLGELATALSPLSANVSLQTARISPEWQHHTALPVVDRRRLYLGTLLRSALNRGLVGSRPPPVAPGYSLLGHLARAFGVSLVGLLQSGSGPDSWAPDSSAESTHER